jgi:hypothetical protein
MTNYEKISILIHQIEGQLCFQFKINIETHETAKGTKPRSNI